MSSPAITSTASARRRLLAALPATLLALTITMLGPLWLDPTADALPVRLWLLNALPLMVLWTIGWLLLGRIVLPTLLVLAFASLFYFAHAAKMATLAQPLLPSDLAALPNLIGSPELFLRYLTPTALLLGLLAAMAVITAWRWERPVLRGWFFARIAGAALLAIAAGSLLSPLGHSFSPYTADRLRTTAWNMPNAAREIGAIALFTKMWPQAHALLSAPDPQALEAAAAHCDERVADLSANALRADAPDLLVVQSESFFDPARLRGLESLQTLVEYRRLSQFGTHGELEVPAFGGLTTRTEFEFLTGFPLATLPAVSYPFQGLVHRQRHALPWALREAGYRTLATHPYDATFYRRDKVYPLLGFQAFHDQDSFGEDDIDGYYVSDHALLSRMRTLLDEAGPQMLFAVTMENHGPWDAGRGLREDEFAALALPDDLDAEDAAELRRYLHHLDNADRSLGELAEWVMQRPQPTILLFYGDHLPALDGVYNTLGFHDEQPPFHQPTPWLMLDNRRSESRRRDVATHQLAALLLDAGGLHHDRYFDMLICLADMAEDAVALQAAVATERLGRAAESARESPEDADWAKVSDWGPAELEAQYASAEDAPTFWLRLEEDEWPAGAALQLGTLRLSPVHRSGGFVLARAAVSHFGVAGEGLPLRLIHPSGQQQQHVGDIALLPAAARLAGDDGRMSRLCAIEHWGPELSPRGEPVNLQPDGRMGLWVKAGCMPSEARIEVDGELLDTTILGHLATAAVHIPAGNDPMTLTLALRDMVSNTRITIGTIRLSDD